MSKSLKNVVNPDDIIKSYGADSMRLYEMFMGPLEAVKPWNTKGVEGVFRFLKRAWRLVLESELTDDALNEEQLRVLHATVKKVGEDLETFGFNTAISQMMIFVNEFSKSDKLPRRAAEVFVKLLSPFAPHITEEMWEYLGHGNTIAYESWPEYKEKYLQVAEAEILVQVLGRPKARIMMPANADNEKMRSLALENAEVQAAVAGKTVRKVICVPGRLVNIVAS
ncbi:MAG: class I tRNA ligase family protein [Victivallales bacterium]|nr:class I tRNA ligase family protein [Victivallales bacterium]